MISKTMALVATMLLICVFVMGTTVLAGPDLRDGEPDMDMLRGEAESFLIGAHYLRFRSVDLTDGGGVDMVLAQANVSNAEDLLFRLSDLRVLLGEHEVSALAQAADELAAQLELLRDSRGDTLALACLDTPALRLPATPPDRENTSPPETEPEVPFEGDDIEEQALADMTAFMIALEESPVIAQGAASGTAAGCPLRYAHTGLR